MSQIFITNIVGTGVFAVPTNQSELTAATSELASIMAGVSANFLYDLVDAWVQDSDIPSGPRSLSCLISGFQYNGEVCPSSAIMTTLLGLIRTAIEAHASITSVGILSANLVDQPGASLNSGTYIDAGPYSYTQGATPLDEVIEQFTFNGSLAAGMTVNFRCSMNPQFSTSGTAQVKLYDLGPVAGPFGTPRLVSTLQETTSGLVNLNNNLVVVSGSPGTDQILDSDRAYEIVVKQTSAENDTVYVGFARLEVMP
jgi:hypothetical protein